VERPQSNPKNDRLKRDYLIYLKEARQRSPATVEQARHAIDRLELYTRFRDFGSFNKEQALGFKRTLIASRAKRSGKQVSISTAHHVLQGVKEFMLWLHGQPGYRRRIVPGEVAYLNLTTKDERKARVTSQKPYASLEQYHSALLAMPTATEMDRRDRALMALLLLTGMRDAAVVGLKLKHISIDREHIFQDPREIKTKFSKAIETFFYPVGPDITAIIREWVEYLTVDKLFAPSDPLFPKTLIGQDQHHTFSAQGLSREHWADAAHVREVFKLAFARVQLPYVNPHSVRNTLTQLAYKLQLSPEQLMAWSKNMGHESVQTTLGCYGQISVERQGEIFEELGRAGAKPKAIELDDETATEIGMQVAEFLKRTNG
jgi:integrase